MEQAVIVVLFLIYRLLETILVLCSNIFSFSAFPRPSPDRTLISPKHIYNIFFVRLKISEITSPNDHFLWKCGHFSRGVWRYFLDLLKR